MPKRIATNELTHDNWDKEEDDNEEDEKMVGASVADDRELKKRRIIRGRRQLAHLSGSSSSIIGVQGKQTGTAVDSTKPNVFAGFAGFGKRSSVSVVLPSNSNSTAAPTVADNVASNQNGKLLTNGRVHQNGINGGSRKDGDTNGCNNDKIIFVDVDKDNSTNDKSTKPSGAGSAETNFVFGNSSSASSISAASSSKNNSMGNGSAAVVQETTGDKGEKIEKMTTKSSCGSNSVRTSTGSNNNAAAATTTVVRSQHQHKQFCKYLKALNDGVYDWIGKHLQTNPYLDLTPVFNDYIQHYKSLEQKFSVANKNKESAHQSDWQENEKSASSSGVLGGSKSQLSTGSFAFGFGSNSKKAVNDDNKETVTTDSMTESTKHENGVSTALAFKPSFPTASTAVLAFGGATSTPIIINQQQRPPDGGDLLPSMGAAAAPFKLNFSFGGGGFQQQGGATTTTMASSSLSNNDDGGKTKNENNDSHRAAPSLFSFGGLSSSKSEALSSKEHNGSQEPPQRHGSAGDEEGGGEYHPPKPDIVVVEEKDAYYSVKCKLFHKVETKYVEKGVGTLHLKKLENGQTQLLIRTDTALGNVLLNTRLSKSTPCHRMGKNNVSIACVTKVVVPSNVAEKCDSSTKSTAIADDESVQQSKDEDLKTMLVLIRVKTGQEADILFEHMDKARKDDK